MSPADELAGSDEQLDQQLRAILENLQQVTKEDDLSEAVGGDLKAYMLVELNRAVDRG